MSGVGEAMKLRRGLATALAGVGLVVLSCSADRGSLPPSAGADASTSTINVEAPVESPAAATRIAELRARFRLAVRAPDEGVAGLARGARAKAEVPTMRAALGEAVATRFEAAAGPDAATHVRAVLPPEALRGVTRAAHVALPVRANGEVTLEDATSHLSVRFALEHVQNARVEVAGGMALYRGALAGADVVHRVHAEGTEDFVVFETRPAREELSYSVDVSRVPGLRLVSNTLEFLDDTGTPLLRVAPPYVVDAVGRRHEAALGVWGCALDTNPEGPWGRKVIKPGAERCSVRVTWAGDIAYPAVVDPAWVATGSLATARFGHTASVLPSGKVLVVGGSSNSALLTSAELYNPAGNGGAGSFAATGSMATARISHTASVLPSGKVLVAGGQNSAAGGTTASAELYDPAGNAGAGTFAVTGSLGTARRTHTASVLGSGMVLIAGGCGGNACTSAELFDPAGNAGAGTFGGTGSMTTARTSHTASVLASGKVLVAGGSLPIPNVATAELYNPGAGTFAATGSMTTGRAGHGASLLPSGKVLVVGGSGLGSPLSAELFDPAANGAAGAFAVTGSMATVRGGFSASVFPSGKVLIAGGDNSAASAELYDPAGNGGAGSFALTGSMAGPRYGHTASVLLSGAVLVAGGSGLGNVDLASAELFSFIALGGTCTLASGTECLSGICADGRCCNAACGAGGCDRCDLPGKAGTCTIAPSGDPGAGPACAAPLACDGVNAACPTSCTSDAACAPSFYCAPDGTCQARKKNGGACNPSANCKTAGCRECTSGYCVDGVCCDNACTGQCEACDQFAGSCGAIDGKPHGGRPDCAPGNECSSKVNQCERPSVATCDGDHTTKSADGTTKDCAPYKCDSNGTCQGLCKSVNDCVAPTICDATGKCVAAAASGEDSGGCSVSRSTHAQRCDSSPLALTIVGALAAFARRRRRRALATRTAAVSSPLGPRELTRSQDS